MRKPASKRGGAREGAGRPKAGREQYITRLHPALIVAIKAAAIAAEKSECEIVERHLAARLKVRVL